MSNVGELTGVDQRQLHGALSDGLNALDLEQEILFLSYSRVVLPLDGYVFWMPGVPFKAQGSLHYAQEIMQEETETYGQAAVTFSSKIQIAEFEATPTNTIYVGKIGKFRYAFAQQNGFYKSAGLWHYFGYSIPPAVTTQFLDTPGQIDPTQAVVSNSLPLWLRLNGYVAPYYDGFKNIVVLYPSFAVPPNLVPPYGTIHIEPSWTRAIQAVRLLDANRNHYQLAADKVRVTLYGLQNGAALDFLDCVLQYSVDTENFGIMNMPIPLDGKRAQPNLEALAMQKIIDFEVDYYQTRAAQVARQLIKEVLIQYVAGSLTANSGQLPPI
jgi:hypothetical protein